MKAGQEEFRYGTGGFRVFLKTVAEVRDGDGSVVATYDSEGSAWNNAAARAEQQRRSSTR